MSLGLNHGRPSHEPRQRGVYIVRFRRQYGERDVEPFEVRAMSDDEAKHIALQRRWHDHNGKLDVFYGGKIDHCPISGKIAWVRGDDVVYLSGPMKIDVICVDSV